MKKSAAKRIKITKNGKVIRRHMGISHFRIKKSSHQLRRKRGTLIMKDGDAKVFKTLEARRTS